MIPNESPPVPTQAVASSAVTKRESPISAGASVVLENSFR